MYLNCSNKRLSRVVHLVSGWGQVLCGWPLKFHMNCCINRTYCEFCIHPYFGCLFFSCSWKWPLVISLRKDKASVHGVYWLYWNFRSINWIRMYCLRIQFPASFWTLRKQIGWKLVENVTVLPKCPISSGGEWEQFGINSMLIICARNGPNWFFWLNTWLPQFQPESYVHFGPIIAFEDRFCDLFLKTASTVCLRKVCFASVSS